MTFNFISFEIVPMLSNNTRGPVARSEPNERELQIKQLFIEGKTLREIGDLQNPKICRERVRQILQRRFGITGKDGGKFLSTTPKIIADTIEKIKIKNEKEERKYQKVFGCTKEKFVEINGCEWNRKKGSAAMSYYQQWHNAVHNRNIEWNITFPEWFDIWQESGHYNERGVGKGYCMARIGDSGGYTKDNVKIITIGQNFSESFLKWSQEHRRNKAVENGKSPLDLTKKEFCKNGHRLEGENLYIWKESRQCKACRKIRQSEYYKKAKSEI